MGKPILFDTISRSKFDALSDEVKSKKNYQIKEEDGTVTKYIGGLEEKNLGGGIYIIHFDYIPNSTGLYLSRESVEEIDAAIQSADLVVGKLYVNKVYDSPMYYAGKNGSSIYLFIYGTNSYNTKIVSASIENDKIKTNTV